MSKPIAYYDPADGRIVEQTTHPHLYLPLRAIDDETREVLRQAVLVVEEAENLKPEFQASIIAALERLTGEGE